MLMFNCVISVCVLGTSLFSDCDVQICSLRYDFFFLNSVFWTTEYFNFNRVQFIIFLLYGLCVQGRSENPAFPKATVTVSTALQKIYRVRASGGTGG